LVNLTKYEDLKKLDHKEIIKSVIIWSLFSSLIAFYLFKLIIKSLDLKIDVSKLYL